MKSIDLLFFAVLVVSAITSMRVQAFFFHQPLSTVYSNSYHENSTQYPNRQNNFNYNYQHSNQFRRDSRTNVNLNGDSFSSILNPSDDIAGCPSECHCNKIAQIADCSNRNLDRVPIGFPKDIKRIRLERNNITELGPYAFQGLKRLQRIDLSNNNLLRIDPLAFSGGLQSLNSLILYSNKLNQLPTNLFSELNQLQLLLLNANSLECIHKDLFQTLANLNLLSLYDNNIETMANGTFDGLKNIKTIHLGKNPLICDCNLRWLADYLELNPIETSEARCEAPTRNQGKKISQLSKQKFECKGSEFGRTSLLANQCNAPPPPPPPAPPSQQLLAIGAQQLGEQSCPRGCVCNGTSVDCLVSSQTESRTGGGLYELPEVADDVSVYVTRMRLNDNRIKKIRQTGIFQKLASSQKLDLGGSKIIDIEDNAINGPTSGLPSQSTKPERVIFVLLEKETHQCDLNAVPSAQGPLAGAPMEPKMPPSEDPCLAAAAGKTNAGPCQNGAACIRTSSSNFTCNCPTGFAGPLCETNIDDCLEHQCQNGAMCVDGLNSYRCVCRDPTTTGEFCEQLSNSFATSSANSISPIALPIVAPKGQGNLPSQVAQASNFEFQQQQQQQQAQSQRQPQSPQSILTRSADFYQIPTNELASSGCRKITERRYYEDGNGCQSIRMLKISECAGSCSESGNGCCLPAKIKRRKIRLQCNDGASYVKTIELVKKCACSDECNRINLVSNQRNQNQSNNRKQNEPTPPMNHRFNSTHDQDQLLQITRLDAVD